MTTRPVRGVEIAEVDEAAVASYLSATPEFFDRHAQLLAKIRLPDSRGGASTVSLLERQVEVLRERNRQLERKVKDFMDVARENDALGTRVLGMARRLIAAPDRAASIVAIESALREDFGAGQSVLVLTALRAPEGIGDGRLVLHEQDAYSATHGRLDCRAAGRPRMQGFTEALPGLSTALCAAARPSRRPRSRARGTDDAHRHHHPRRRSLARRRRDRGRGPERRP